MLLLTLVVLLLSAARGETYSTPGPYGFEEVEWERQAPPATINFRPWFLSFKITYPLKEANEESPLVFFYSGFEIPSSFYKDYAAHLASYGYVVVQYDKPITRMTPDSTEISWFSSMVDWVVENTDNSAIPVKVNRDAISVAGHSRGAKLAVLIAEEHPEVKTLFLIDPIDGDKESHCGTPNYPSAVAALRNHNLKVAMTGSSVRGPCNPEAYDYHHFWEGVGDGSWKFVINNAGHMQFTSGPRLRQWALNRLCGTGKTDSKDVINDAKTSMVAWFEYSLGTEVLDMTNANEESPLTDFFNWVEDKINTEEMTFEIKGTARMVM